MKTIKTNDLKPGMIVRVHQKIKEKDAKGKEKERVQVFEGTIISKKGGGKTGATFTVRKIGANEIGVEKIFPIYLPTIEKVELVKKLKTRKSKLYYIRSYKKKIKEKK